MHTLLDLRGSIPTFIDITHGRSHDVLTLDRIVFEPGAFYVMDRGYLSFRRLFRIHQTGAFFVTRALTTTQMGRQCSRPVSRATGLRSDQTVLLTGVKTRDYYPVALRRVTYCDLPTGKRFVFLTNNFLLPALTIAQLYQSRSTIEVFFDSSTWCTPSDVYGISRFNGCGSHAGQIARNVLKTDCQELDLYGRRCDAQDGD